VVVGQGNEDDSSTSGKGGVRVLRAGLPVIRIRHGRQGPACRSMQRAAGMELALTARLGSVPNLSHCYRRRMAFAQLQTGFKVVCRSLGLSKSGRSCSAIQTCPQANMSSADGWANAYTPRYAAMPPMRFVPASVPAAAIPAARLRWQSAAGERRPSACMRRAPSTPLWATKTAIREG
jgi:hypothetical protein